MGDIISIFDEKRMQYVSVPVEGGFSSRVNNNDLENIEAALIRFADELAIAN